MNQKLIVEVYLYKVHLYLVYLYFILSIGTLSIPILSVLLSGGNAFLPRQKHSNFPLKIRNIKIETHQKRLLEDEE